MVVDQGDAGGQQDADVQGDAGVQRGERRRPGGPGGGRGREARIKSSKRNVKSGKKCSKKQRPMLVYGSKLPNSCKVPKSLLVDISMLLIVVLERWHCRRVSTPTLKPRISRLDPF